MEKQISFDGVALTPYNDIAPDGQLSACCGLERHAGSLRPVVLSGTKYTKSDASSNKLVYVHNTAYYNHFIFFDASSGSLSWSEQTENITINPFGTVTGFKSINSIGNTLIVTTDSKMIYYLFGNNTYQDLGEMPDASISFGLQGSCVRGETVHVAIERISYTSLHKEFSEKNKETITNAVMAEVNSFINSQYSEKGKFIFPFILRYALRLYDGTLTHHSAPILMLCMNKNAYAVVENIVIGRDLDAIDFRASAAVFDVDYTGFTNIHLKKWSDIIRSVDVFISEPIYSYYPDGVCEKFNKAPAFGSTAVCKHKDSSFYEDISFVQLYENYFAKHFSECVGLPYKTDEEIDSEIKKCSNFYLVKSIPLDDLAWDGKRKKLDIKPEILKNLVFQEKMTDDYLSHDKINGQYTFTYNQRLILANVRRKLFGGFTSNSMFCYSNKQPASHYSCFVYIKEDGKDIIVDGSFNIEVLNPNYMPYFFYPNINAYKVVINSAENKDNSIVFNLTPHPLLNGAYYYNGWKETDKSAYIDVHESAEEDQIINIPNKLYTSEVGNPFHFPLRGINTIGVGEIVGVSSVTVALSQGQFGSFPLMAFCTDGNYVLQVNAEGLFSAVFPMQRDVCVNPDSITQIDGAVVFVSSRGVMVADGSVISCISDILNGVFDNLDYVNNHNKFLSSIPAEAPIDFFRSCMISYDYAGKRMIFFSKELEKNAAWILSLEDNTWSQAELSGITSVLNSYPYSYIESNNVIVRLDEAYRYAAGKTHDGMLVTRPIKLDSYQLKSLRQVSLVGTFSMPQTVGIYGSNDGNTWFPLGKSKAGRILTPGRYFKYYRFSVETELTSSENISGLRIEYEVRPERRFR